MWRGVKFDVIVSKFSLKEVANQFIFYPSWNCPTKGFVVLVQSCIMEKEHIELCGISFNPANGVSILFNRDFSRESNCRELQKE
jgi:hypothetical protein